MNQTNHSDNSSQTNQSHLEVWSLLKSRNLVTGDMPPTNTVNEASNYAGSWAIRILQGFAGWMAAIFLIAFIASVFSWLFRGETAVILICFGIGGCVLAYAIFNMSKKNDFFDQLGLVFNLAGQFMFAFGLYELINDWNDRHYTLYFFLLFTFQFLLVLFIPNFLSRLLSSWFGLISLFLAFSSYGVYGLSAAIVTIAFALIWMNETQWGKHRPLLEPVGYGFALSLLQFNSELAFSVDFRWFMGGESNIWISQYTDWIRLLLLNIAIIWFIFKIAKLNEIALRSKTGFLLLVGGGLLLLIGSFIPGVSGALLLLLIGFSVVRPILVGLGVISLITFISWYYYNLNLTLLDKSIILMMTGLVLLLSVYLLRKFKLIESETESLDSKLDVNPASISVRKIKWIVTGVMFIAIMLVNYNIYKKEMVLEKGQLVLLKLAPVDPRSLMQGDYMRLRFNIETRLSEADKHLADSNNQASDYFVVELDKQSVATFSHLYQGEVLSGSQVKMQYRIKRGRIYLATHAFFFQEGTAKEYEKAKFGEFRVAENGELLLNALRDESLNVLGLNRPEN